jgi:hypothetical protein
MTISATPRKAGPFIGDGVTVLLPFTFKVFARSDVLVVRADPQGVESELLLDGDYTVTLNLNQDSDPGGTVTLVVALEDGYTAALGSKVPETQGAVFTDQGGFFPRILNDSLDRLTILVQQLLERLNRTLYLPLSTPTGVSTQLPRPQGNKYLQWNSEGTQLVNATGLSVDVSEFGFKSLKQNPYTGSSVVTVEDNGKSHFKTDHTPVSIPNTLPVEHLTTIINFSSASMALTFTDGVAHQQGSDDPTGRSSWSLAARNSANIAKVADGAWLISGKVVPL